MKLLILLLAILFGLWLWKRGRSAAKVSAQDNASDRNKPNLPIMAQCLYCQVHLPMEDAFRGRLGLYCSDAHRIAAGDRDHQA